MKQEPVTVSDTQNVDPPIMAFLIRFFEAQYSKGLNSKQLKNRTTLCILKTLNVKISTCQNGQYLSARSQSNFNSLFGDTQYIAHTASYSKHRYLKHYLLKRCCSIFKPKFCTIRNAKINKCLPRCFKTGAF